MKHLFCAALGLLVAVSTPPLAQAQPALPGPVTLDHTSFPDALKPSDWIAFRSQFDAAVRALRAVGQELTREEKDCLEVAMLVKFFAQMWGGDMFELYPKDLRHAGALHNQRCPPEVQASLQVKVAAGKAAQMQEGERLFKTVVATAGGAFATWVTWLAANAAWIYVPLVFL